MAERSKAQTLAWLRANAGEWSTATLRRLDETLPWYRDMPPGRRSSVGLVAQAGITSFISWFDDPKATQWIAADVFGAAPRELLRSVSLTQTLQLIKTTVEVIESRIPQGNEALHEAFLLYSREIAFAAADVYARAAESRGLWDARLEALVVDSILTGEYDAELPSRVAALGWNGHGEVAVLVGVAPRQLDVDHLRRTARHLASDVLIGVQGNRLVVVIGRSEAAGADRDDSALLPFRDIAAQLEPNFGEGHLVLGPEVPALVDAARSARAALAGFAVARAWRSARGADLRAAAGAVHRPAADAVVLPRQRPIAGGDRPRAVRPSEHGALPPQADRRDDRLGRHGRPGGAHPAVGAHRRRDPAAGGPAPRLSQTAWAKPPSACAAPARCASWAGTSRPFASIEDAQSRPAR